MIEYTRAFAAIHSCGKIVAAAAYEPGDPSSHIRAANDARKWEKRGDEIIETDADFVRANPWCECFRKKAKP